jgi:integrase
MTELECPLLRRPPASPPDMSSRSVSFRGKPIVQVSTKAWYAALERAGIQDFRWHDLRHCWAAWHVQNGTPLFALQELGGWENPEMVRRYAHHAADHLAPYAERLCAMRAVAVESDGTITAQR